MNNKKLILTGIIVCSILLLILFWKQMIFLILIGFIGFLLLKLFGGDIKEKIKSFFISAFLKK